MQVNGSMSPPPIPSRRPETVRQPELPILQPMPDESEATVDNQTRVYNEAPIAEPSSLEFPSLSPSVPAPQSKSPLDATRQTQLRTLDSLVNQGKIPNDDPDNTAQYLASTLGFQSPDMMLHHLRHLSESARAQLMSNLRHSLANSTESTESLIQTVFETTFTNNINSLIEKQGAPAPVLSGSKDSRWDTAALASLYNAITTIEQQSPTRLATLLERAGHDEQGNQKSLRFIREREPSIRNTDRFLEGLTDASKIATAQPDTGTIRLYDAAVSGDHTQITQNIVGKLDLISRIDRGNGRDLEPRYTAAELEAHGLNLQPNETADQHASRLRQKVSTDWVNRFGGWENLQRAMNFVIGYKALDDVNVINRNNTSDQQRPPFSRVAVTGEPDELTLQQIDRMGVNNLQTLMIRMEQQDAVKQMQKFLAENAPPGSAAQNIDFDGLLGPQTQQVVLGFETALALNTLRERVEDDPNIPETEKVELVAYLNQQFASLAADHTRSSQIAQDVSQRLQQLLSENTSMAAHTRTGLQSDLENMGSLRNGLFDRKTAEHLVNTWFNVMDSGQGHDLAEQLLVHEMGHLWESQLNRSSDLDIRSNWSQFFAPEQHESTGFGMSQITQNDFNNALRDDHTAASAYGAINPEEDFAEASRTFSYDPQHLMRRSLAKFLVMNTLNDKPFSTQEIRTMAAECGYRPEEILQRLDAVLGHGNHGLTFTLPLAERLNTDYAALRTELQSEVADRQDSSELEHAGAPAPKATPETELLYGIASLPPTVDNHTLRNGEGLNALSTRYHELFQQLEQPGANRAVIQSEIQGLNQEILNLDDSELNAQLNQRTLGDTPEAGRALLAALAIFQATGDFDRNDYPELAQHLHPSVDLVLQNPSIRSALKSSDYAADHLLNQVLDFCEQGVNNFNIIDRAFDLSANSRLQGIGNQLRDILSTSEGADRDQQLTDFFQTGPLKHSHLSQINAGVIALNQTTGQNYPLLTLSQLRDILVQGLDAERQGAQHDYGAAIMATLETTRYTRSN